MNISHANILHNGEFFFISSPNSLSFQIMFFLYIETSLQRDSVSQWLTHGFFMQWNVACHGSLNLDRISDIPFLDLHSYCLSTKVAKHSSSITGPKMGLPEIEHYATQFKVCTLSHRFGLLVGMAYFSSTFLYVVVVFNALSCEQRWSDSSCVKL